MEGLYLLDKEVCVCVRETHKNNSVVNNTHESHLCLETLQDLFVGTNLLCTFNATVSFVSPDLGTFTVVTMELFRMLLPYGHIRAATSLYLTHSLHTQVTHCSVPHRR